MFFAKPFVKNPWEGAQTTIYAALANDLVSGGYYASCREAPTSPLAQDEGLAKSVWKLTEDAIKSVGTNGS